MQLQGKEDILSWNSNYKGNRYFSQYFFKLYTHSAQNLSFRYLYRKNFNNFSIRKSLIEYYKLLEESSELII